MHNALLNTERKSKSCTINADAEIISGRVVTDKYTGCKMASCELRSNL